MTIPNDRKYLASHEWHKINGDIATIGISQIAADELTDITYISLPKVGDTLAVGGRFGEVESVKATSDLYTGLAGTVTEVNEPLNGDPGLINRDPYEAGWIMKLRMTNPSDADALLDGPAYEKNSGH